jgi:hypothetical protein
LIVCCCLLPLNYFFENRALVGARTMIFGLILLSATSRLPFYKQTPPDLDWPQKSLGVAHMLRQQKIAVTRVNPGWLCVIHEADFVPPDSPLSKPVAQSTP